MYISETENYLCHSCMYKVKKLGLKMTHYTLLYVLNRVVYECNS